MTITSARQITITPEAFHGSESGHVYGIIDDPEQDFPAIADELLAAGVPLDAVHLYRSCGDPVTAGSHTGGHGLLARMHRRIQSVDGHLHEVATELAQGHALIGVAIEDARKDEIAETLRQHRGRDVVYYGRYTWQWLGA